MSNYSDDTFGMNCPGPCYKQYIIESAHRLMTRCWGHIFQRDCRLGLRGAIEVVHESGATSLSYPRFVGMVVGIGMIVGKSEFTVGIGPSATPGNVRNWGGLTQSCRS
jgi:hypothetical protein